MSIHSFFKTNKFAKHVKYNLCSFATIISPRLNTRLCYLASFGKRLNLKNPKNLNEKILWLKLNRYIHDPLVIQCADKYRVREYVEKCGCADILNGLIGVYQHAKDIPWDELPMKFVLKWNIGAGMNIICIDKSKMDKAAVIDKMAKWEKAKPWLSTSEMQYKYAPKCIVCERLIETPANENAKTMAEWTAPEDYKLYCFHGEPKYIMVCVGRENGGHPKYYFFDTDWKLARINRDSVNAPANFEMEKPNCIERLLDCAKKLSKPFPFVRTDFYVVGDKIYFGELTFTPGGGLDSARLPETDRMFGDMLSLQ